MREKSSVEEIRERFDHDVERFSNLQSGQVSTVDAALSLELITEAAARLTPLATDLLDVGCGAGNYTLKMLSKRPGLHCSVVENIRNQFIRQGMPHRQNAAGLPAQASPPAAARVSPASRLAYPRPASVAAMPPIAVSRSSIGSWRPTRYIASTT